MLDDLGPLIGRQRLRCLTRNSVSVVEQRATDAAADVRHGRGLDGLVQLGGNEVDDGHRQSQDHQLQTAPRYRIHLRRFL